MRLDFDVMGCRCGCSRAGALPAGCRSPASFALTCYVPFNSIMRFGAAAGFLSAISADCQLGWIAQIRTNHADENVSPDFP